MSNSIYKERREKMAAFLRTLKPEQFDITEMINDCGTVCCIAGWTPKVFPDEVKEIVIERTRYSYQSIQYNDFNDITAACNFYGTVNNDVFYADYIDYPTSNPTPQQAAQALLDAPYKIYKDA